MVKVLLRRRGRRSAPDQYRPNYDPDETAGWEVGRAIRQRAVRYPFRGVFEYVLRGRGEHERGDGRVIPVLVWEGVCPVCGASFSCWSPTWVGSLIRGCPEHRPWYRHVARPVETDEAAAEIEAEVE